MTGSGVLIFEVPQQGIAGRSEAVGCFEAFHLLPPILPTAVLALKGLLFGV